VQPPKPAAIGGRVKPPRLLKSAPPVYPPVARQRKMEGDVAIEATVDASGKVAATRIVSGPALFHQAALDAVRNWKYQPATLNDQPVSADVLVVLKFRINK
jgi:protein TonB